MSVDRTMYKLRDKLSSSVHYILNSKCTRNCCEVLFSETPAPQSLFVSLPGF